jgi:hypothetical protein
MEEADELIARETWSKRLKELAASRSSLDLAAKYAIANRLHCHDFCNLIIEVCEQVRPALVCATPSKSDRLISLPRPVCLPASLPGVRHS